MQSSDTTFRQKESQAVKVKYKNNIVFTSTPSSSSSSTVSASSSGKVVANDTSKHDDNSGTKSTEQATAKKDIGHYYNKVDQLGNSEKYDLMENVWKPLPSHRFPVKVESGAQKRKFNLNWLNDHKWLTYSEHLDGAFCLACVLFGRRIGKNSSKLDKLFRSPLTTWSTATLQFSAHENGGCDIHETAMLTMKEFRNSMEQRSVPIDQTLTNAKKALVDQNKKKIVPIIKTVMFCGRQKIALRGHRDILRTGTWEIQEIFKPC